MLSASWLAGLLRRRPVRLVGAVAGVALAVALLASIGAFVSSAKSSMTSHAAAAVAVDWQVKTQPGADPQAVLGTVVATVRPKAALPVDFLSVSGLSSRVGGSTQTTGTGVVVGLPAGYESVFPAEIRPLVGDPSGVVLAQQTASNLHAAPGDSITVLSRDQPVTFRVDGVVDLPLADSLFQKVGAPAGAQPSAPPDNVVLLPDDTWHRYFDAISATRPELADRQIHVSLHHNLAADPSVSFSQVTGAAHRLELALAGSGLVGDNLGAALGAARSDALYAQVLFLLLGLPGAFLAGGLTAAVASSGAARRRQEQAVLRARGATGSQLVRLAVAEAAVVGLAGSAVGVGAAALIGIAAFNSASFGATTASSLGWSAGAAAAGILIAAVTIALPAWRDSRRVTVAESRRRVEPYRHPLWARYGLDVILAAGAGLIVWQTTRSGYNLVLAPEGVASISVSYWALLGPILAWMAAGLLIWRITAGSLGRLRGGLRWTLRPFAGALANPVTSSLARQRRRLAAAVVLLGLSGAFAGSTAVFNSTYRQQVGVDAALTNGADVTVSEPPGSAVGPGSVSAIAAVPGVSHVEPLQHRFAYVGSDLQDLFGIRPGSINRATTLEDAYFSGGTARQLLARLDARPDGILVSAETVRDFQLQLGDLLRLRLRDSRSGALQTVAFHYVGVAKEFPTAPRDSFLVANASYISGKTGSGAVGAFLVKTVGAPPPAVAARIRGVVGTSASVSDIQSSRREAGSSLTAVDLSGLTKVELGFALGLAAASSGLLMALVLAERRRTFAIVAALGGRPRQVAAFARAEAAFVIAAGLIAAVASAWGLAIILTKVLTGVFDPPPAHLAVPWTYLIVVAVVSVAATLAAAELTVRWTRRPIAEALRDL